MLHKFKILTPEMPEAERARWKIVRRDTHADIPGLILSASEETGLCMMRGLDGAAKEHNFGPDGIRIVRADQ